MFKDYHLHNVGVLSTRIEEMDALSLNYWLSNFVMEVAKKGGESCPPKTVYGIACGVRRHLEEKDGAEVFTCNPFFKINLFKGQISGNHLNAHITVLFPRPPDVE